MPPTARRSSSSTRPRAGSSARRRWVARRTSTAPSRRQPTAFDDRKGWANWAAGKRGRTLAKYASLVKQHSEELAQTETRNIGKAIMNSRGEAVGVSLVLDYYAGAANKVFGETIPVGRPGHRADAPRTDRRDRRDRAVELPDVHGLVEARAGARRRQHGRAQAGQRVAVDRDPPGRARPRGGHPAGRPQRGHGPRRNGRRIDRRARGHRQGRVHGRDDHRAGDHAAGRIEREEDQPRARRQEPERRLRGRRPREVRA